MESGAAIAQQETMLQRPTQRKGASFWRIVQVTIVKNLQTTKRYLPNLIGNLMQLVIRAAFFLLVSNFAVYQGSTKLEGHTLFIFYLGALLLFMFNGTALGTPLQSVNEDMMNGTLEYLYSNPISRYAYYVGGVIASALVELVPFVPFFIFLVVYSGDNWFNTIYILLACIAVLITLMALGTMIALLALLWRQVTAIAGVLNILFEFLAGAYFPVTSYPHWLQYCAFALPYTWGYDLVRYYALGRNWVTILPVNVEWVILLAEAVIFTIVARYLLKRVEKHVKKRGLALL